jgi:hypothetical protein
MHLYVKTCGHESGRTMFAPTKIMIQRCININILKGTHFSLIVNCTDILINLKLSVKFKLTIQNIQTSLLIYLTESYII